MRWKGLLRGIFVFAFHTPDFFETLQRFEKSNPRERNIQKKIANYFF
jgi:hypothetical protein